MLKGGLMTLNDEVNRFDNPIYYPNIAMSIGLTLFLFLVAIMAYDDNIVEQIVSIFFLVTGIVYFAIEFFMQIGNRPSTVVTKEDGLLLKYRWMNFKNIPWQEIEWVGVSETHEDSCIKVRNMEYLIFIRTYICDEIRRKHYFVTGWFPYTKEEFWATQPPSWKKTSNLPIKMIGKK